MPFFSRPNVKKVNYSSKYSLIDCVSQEQNAADKKKSLVQTPEVYYADKACFNIDGVLSKDECQKIIQRSEEAGFRTALFNEILDTDYRNSERCVIDDKEFANALFERIKDELPQTISDSSGLAFNLECLNERMRVLRYGPGHFFAEHRDGQYSRNAFERSFLTVMIYLNEGGGKDFTGGSTNFVARGEHQRQISEVVPQSGRILVFDHVLMHEGAKLVTGTKYAIRTDVMYKKCSPKKNQRTGRRMEYAPVIAPWTRPEAIQVEESDSEAEE